MNNSDRQLYFFKNILIKARVVLMEYQFENVKVILIRGSFKNWYQ